MECPPQYFDLNPIEHHWIALKNRLQLYADPPISIHLLCERVCDGWVQIPVSTCENFRSSMPTRTQAV